MPRCASGRLPFLVSSCGVFPAGGPKTALFLFAAPRAFSYLCLVNEALRHTAQDYTVSLPAAEYIAVYRDARRFGACCRACPNYGRSWACPPFDFDMDDYLSGYRTALIIATKITPVSRDLPLSEAERLLRPERQWHERLLLDLEARYGGRAFAYTGTCLYCPKGSCTRPEGLPCRHPERVRPSLEACGFDLCRTTESLMGIPLRWSTDGRLPEYLTLVGGFFHNADAIDLKAVWQALKP